MRTIVAFIIAVVVAIAVAAAFGAGHGGTIARVGDYFGYFALGLFILLVLATVAAIFRKLGQALGLIGPNAK